MDLLIRTSGESRLSDFLLWQSATAQIAFVPALWPDFSYLDLLGAVVDYQLGHPAMQVQPQPALLVVLGMQLHSSNTCSAAHLLASTRPHHIPFCLSLCILACRLETTW